MKIKSVYALMAFALAMILLMSPEAYAGARPRMDYLLADISYDVMAEWMKLKGGTVDVMDWPLTSAMIDEAKTLPDIVTVPVTDLGMREFDLNCKRWPTDDVVFRRAIALLVNKPKIILDILKGYGARLDTVVPPGALAAYVNTDVCYPNYPWEYDPALAEQMLEDAGYLPWPAGRPPLLFWARLDDPDRTDASFMLKTELEALGIPVDYRPADRSVTNVEVMTNFNFNIYSGGWGLARDLDYVHDLYSSEFYRPKWYNYVGFTDPVFDAEADNLKYAVDNTMVMSAAKKCQEIMVDQVPTIPIWSSVSKLAYRAGWDNVVNFEGVGPNNFFTFFGTTKTGKNTVVYGFKSDIEGLNPVTAEWTWDWQAMGLIYDSLIVGDPYILSLDYNWMTQWYSVNTWVDPSDGVTKHLLKFHLLPEGTMKWHAPQTGSLINNDVTVHDVKFSFDYIKDQEGWFYSSVMDIKYALTHAEAGEPGAPAPTDTDEIWVYMDVLSFWTLHWVGGVPIINKEIWQTVPDAYAYDPLAAGKVVGCGPWRFVERVVGSYLKFEAVNYYKTTEWDDNVLQEAFHRAGDVDNNRQVWLTDYAKVAKLFKATPYSPAPTYLPPAGCSNVKDEVGNLPHTRTWRIAQLFKDEDVDYDGRIYLKDLATVGKNWGRVAG